MIADPGRICIDIGAAPEQFKAHHGDIPELYVDGDSARDAVANLAQELERERDSTPDNLHRWPLDQAIADVRAYIEQES
jgi:hypothetical protein